MAGKETRQDVEASSLCTNDCGFFGNAATLGMCSVCYTNHSTRLASAEAELAAKFRVAKSKELQSGRKNSGPVLLDFCARNCGFVGKLMSGDNLCFNCHRSQQKKVAVGKGIAQVGASGEAETKAAVQLLPKPAEDQPEKAREDNCCSACHNKLSLRSVLCGKCKCGEVFCSTHRQAEHHSCTFDHRAAARSAITKANPLVKRDKMKDRI